MDVVKNIAWAPLSAFCTAISTIIFDGSPTAAFFAATLLILLLLCLAALPWILLGYVTTERSRLHIYAVITCIFSILSYQSFLNVCGAVVIAPEFATRRNITELSAWNSSLLVKTFKQQGHPVIFRSVVSCVLKLAVGIRSQLLPDPCRFFERI